MGWQCAQRQTGVHLPHLASYLWNHPVTVLLFIAGSWSVSHSQLEKIKQIKLHKKTGIEL